MSKNKTNSFIKLPNSIMACGEMLGKLCAPVLCKRIEEIQKIRKHKKISITFITARIDEFKKHVAKLVPHWLGEVKGMANGAKISVDDILMINCLPGDFYEIGNDCTSFIEIGESYNRLLKIRDNRPQTQTFLIRNIFGKMKYQCGHDIGNIGVAHFFNQYAVACAGNTGSITDRVSDKPLLHGNHIMRFFAEHTQKIKDVPKLAEKLICSRTIGGIGKDRGVIYLFADPTGGVILEMVPNDYSVKYIEKGVVVVSNHFLSRKGKKWISVAPDKNTILRKKRMEELLQKEQYSPFVKNIFKIARDRKNLPHALCNDDKKHSWMSVSAQLQVINRSKPDGSINYVCCGNPRHACFFPVPLKFDLSFVPLINGEFYERSDKLYKKYCCNEHMNIIQNHFENKIIKDPNPGFIAELFKILKQENLIKECNHNEN